MTRTAFLAGAAPAVVWMAFFWWWDRHHREPLHLIFVLFLVGAIPVGFAAGVINTAVASTVGLTFVATAVLVAPVVEESLKYLGAKVTAGRSRAFDEPVDGMVYGSAVGLGFAAAENVGYLVLAATELTGQVDLFPECAGMTADECAVLLVLPIRAMGTTFIHGLASGLAGFTLSRKRFRGLMNLPYPWLPGLLAAIALHAAWNYYATDGGTSPLLVTAVGAAGYATVFRACLRISPHARGRLVQRG